MSSLEGFGTCSCDRCVASLLASIPYTYSNVRLVEQVLNRNGVQFILMSDDVSDSWEARAERAKLKIEVLTGTNKPCYFCGLPPEICSVVGKVKGHGAMICTTCAVVQLT